MREVGLKRGEFAELSTELLELGGSLSFKAHGFSMSPFIRNGDILSVQPVEVTALKAGDIAFYRIACDRLVVHRIIGRFRQASQVVFKIRGDALYGPDELVQADQILGQVMSVQRGRKVIRLDQGFWNLASHLWIKLYPLGPLFFKLEARVKKVASWFLRRLQALKP